MKITYTQNPLNTIIELDELEKKELWYKIKCSELEELLSNAHFTLTHVEWYNKSIKPQTLEEAVAEATKELDPEYYCTDEKSPLDKRVDELFQYYTAELMSSHSGDCICFPASCLKCHTESILGINTIKGLGKHAGHKIHGAFSNGRDKEGKWLPEKSINEALESLRTYDPRRTDGSINDAVWAKVGGFEAHIPRWKAEAASAYEWLLNYRNTHFKELS